MSEQIQIIVNRLQEQLTQAENFIDKSVNVEYWQGVKAGVELALDGFRATGIGTANIKIFSIDVSETGTTDLHLINGTSVPFASPESALRWVLQRKPS